MRHLVLSLAAALLVAPPALADEWEDLGDAILEDDSTLKDVDEPADEAERAPEASPASAAPAGDVETMKLVSAATSAGLLAFAGTGVGVALAFTNGALWSLLPNAQGNFRSVEMQVWLGFWTLPVLGAAGAAAFGALPYMEPLGVGATSAAAAAGAGLGALAGWGIGYAAAVLLHGTAPSVAFPNHHKPEWSGTLGTGILLGAAVGAATGAATIAPFFVPGVLEALSAPQE